MTPSRSADGSEIAFDSDKDRNYEIYVMNADGSVPTRLTYRLGNDAQPEWSPDGSEIAFDSDKDRNYEIYVMNADGSNQVNLTNSPARDRRPAWFPGLAP